MLSNGSVAENWQVVNEDIKILERTMKGKLSKAEEEVRAILSTESCSGLGKLDLDDSHSILKTRPHKPYVGLWE